MLKNTDINIRKLCNFIEQYLTPLVLSKFFYDFCLKNTMEESSILSLQSLYFLAAYQIFMSAANYLFPWKVKLLNTSQRSDPQSQNVSPLSFRLSQSCGEFQNYMWTNNISSQFSSNESICNWVKQACNGRWQLSIYIH